ncbi:DUF4142 domain-containing protein [Acetobacter conturbans]|uniref:DUF4142 domain-containing protein n=1 Tax=Acetobacter conturbans TaxID=1737472 RepID=UPI001F54EB6C|nr:DUF4142 domain-containing protein [Acetobacter conturbans]
MKTFSKIAAVAALTGLAACATTPPPAPPAPPPPAALSDTDATFVQTVAQINLAETALGKLAATNAGTAGVKNYAQHMVTDHTAAEDQLTTIASGHGVTLPTDPNADDQKTIKTLGAEKGATFDRAYVANAITGHTKAVKLASDEAASTTDADLKSFAQSFQKTAQAHLEAAEALKNHRGHTGVYRGHRHAHTH